MSRRDAAWLADILVAIDAIEAYVAGGSLSEGLVYDACRVRLIEIGEAVKNIDPNLLATIPSIRWRAISRMRDRLAHHYFDTDHALVEYSNICSISLGCAPIRSAANHWDARRSGRGPHRRRVGRDESGPSVLPSTSPVGWSRRPVTKPRFEHSLLRTGRRWPASTSPSLPANRSRWHGPWPTPTPRRRSMPAIATPSRSSSPTPSARSSTRVRGETAWSKRTLRAWWLLPSPTGIRGPATPSSMTMWWWPTGPGRSPMGPGAPSTHGVCSRAWSCSESCTKACWPTC